MALLPADDEGLTVETRVASPAHFLFRIGSFSQLRWCGIQHYESTDFEAGGYKWRLEIYPEGQQSENKEHISAYLAIAETSSLHAGWEVNAFFSICLFNQISDNYLCFRGKACRFNPLNLRWGFSKLISRKCFTDPTNGYLVDDSCALGAEVFVIKRRHVCEYLSLKPNQPYKHEWKISKFSKIKNAWISEKFTVGGCKWNVTLNPNGHPKGDDGRSISIYLSCVGLASPKKVMATYCFTIKSQVNKDKSISKKGHSWFTSSAPTWGWMEFAPFVDVHDNINGYVVKDRCVLLVEVSVVAISNNVP